MLRNLHLEQISKALVQREGFIPHFEEHHMEVNCLPARLFPPFCSALLSPDLGKSTPSCEVHPYVGPDRSQIASLLSGAVGTGEVWILGNTRPHLLSLLFVCSCQGEGPKGWRGDLTQINDKNSLEGASLVAQWLRICLPMQGTRVRALVWEDPTCRGATGPVSHNY